MYIMITFALRLMGKRQIGELQPSELVITLLVSELASLPMQDTGIPLAMGVLPILALICIEVIISFVTMKFKPMRKILSGRPVAVIENGKINQKNLYQLRQTVEDLLTELRQKDAFDINSVIYAQIETNGKLSVLVDSQQGGGKQSFYNTVIADGEIEKEALVKSGHDMKWVRGRLKKSGISDVADVFLMLVDSDGNSVIQKKENVGGV